MAQLQNIGGLVSAVFQAWKSARIDFLVLRNYESLPEFTSNDIDILVAQKDLRQAEQLLISIAGQNTFFLHNRVEFSTLALYFFQPDTLQQVHFDLFTDLQWRGLQYLSTASFLAEKIDRGIFFVPAPPHEAAANLLGLFIYTGNIKDKYKNSIRDGFRAQPDVAIRLLTRTYGQSLAKFLVENSISENWKEIEDKFSVVRNSLIFRQIIGNFFSTFCSLARNFLRVLKRFFQPPGLMIVLLGADGSGKSTAGAALLEQLQNTFSAQKNIYLHWKPRVFSKSNSAPATHPHGQKTRGRAVSILFFAFHWIEFFLGAWKQIRPALFRGGLVVVDRYFFDMQVDQKRYRLNLPQIFIRFGCFFLHKPDLVFIFDAPPEILQSRKQEVSPAETARQREAYRALAKSVPNSFLLDAAQPMKTVAANASRIVLDFLRERTKKRRAQHSNDAC